MTHFKITVRVSFPNHDILYLVVINAGTFTHIALFTIYISFKVKFVGRVAQSVLRLTTGWTVRDRIPVGMRFSARPDRPWGPLSLLYVKWVTGLSRGYRRSGRGADPHPHVVPKVLENSKAIPLLTLRTCVAYKTGENLPKVKFSLCIISTVW